MASGRILKTQISLSEQVSDLSVHAALLFTWMIPHADDFGRLCGNARKVKALVVPMRDDFTSVKVEECLNEIAKVQLIERYEVNGEFFIQFPSFEDHQSGLHKRTKSKLPAPPENIIPGISGNFHLEEKRSEEKRTEQNTTVLSAKETGNDDLTKATDLASPWIEYFVNKKGFQIHEAQTAKTVPMFVDWTKRGVTEADVELAMIAAHNYFGKDKADNPVGYRKFVDTVMIEKQRGNNGSSKPNKTLSSRPVTGNKPSLADQADQGVERVRQRKLREQEEQHSVVN